jgi:hypothetical protein
MPLKKEDLPGTLQRSPEKVKNAYTETLDSAEEHMLGTVSDARREEVRDGRVGRRGVPRAGPGHVPDRRAVLPEQVRPGPAATASPAGSLEGDHLQGDGGDRDRRHHHQCRAGLGFGGDHGSDHGRDRRDAAEQATGTKGEAQAHRPPPLHRPAVRGSSVHPVLVSAGAAAR